MTGSRPFLAIALLALAALFAVWFGRGAEWFAVVIFALPPALLAVAAWRRWKRAGFWAGVLALLWFSHGVMVAWTRAAQRPYAWGEIVLALIVVALASVPGLRARFGGRR